MNAIAERDHRQFNGKVYYLAINQRQRYVVCCGDAEIRETEARTAALAWRRWLAWTMDSEIRRRG